MVMVHTNRQLFSKILLHFLLCFVSSIRRVEAVLTSSLASGGGDLVHGLLPHSVGAAFHFSSMAWCFLMKYKKLWILIEEKLTEH